VNTIKSLSGGFDDAVSDDPLFFLFPDDLLDDAAAGAGVLLPLPPPPLSLHFLGGILPRSVVQRLLHRWDGRTDKLNKNYSGCRLVDVENRLVGYLCKTAVDLRRVSYVVVGSPAFFFFRGSE
jgi:hypothetical protein